jgi:hypothetical protein
MSAMRQQKPAVSYAASAPPTAATTVPELPATDTAPPSTEPPQQDPVTVPGGNMPTPNVACTVDPLLNVGLNGAAAVTIPVGGQIGLQTVATSDSSSVIWLPQEPVVWGDGTTASPLAPVVMVLSYPLGTITGSSAAYSVRALPTAIPGTTYSLSWRAEDGSRGLCKTLTIQVTITGSTVTSI